MLALKTDLQATIGHAEDVLRRKKLPASLEHEQQDEDEVNRPPPCLGFTDIALRRQFHPAAKLDEDCRQSKENAKRPPQGWRDGYHSM
jgi:hypothetical protein